MKKAVSVLLSAALLLGMSASVGAADVKQVTYTLKQETGSGMFSHSYKASIGFQTTAYDQRLAYYDPVSYKLSTADKTRAGADQKYNEWAAVNGITVPDYRGANIYLNGNVPELWQRGEHKGELKAPEKVELCQGAVVTETSMQKDGEYTLKISDMDLKKTDDTGRFTMLYIATNILNNSGNSDVVVKLNSLLIGGKTVAQDTVLPVRKNGQDETLCFMIADGYSQTNGTGTAPFPYSGKAESFDAKTDLAVPQGKFDIEINYTISKVNWNEAPYDVAEPTATPVTTSQPAQTEAPKPQSTSSPAPVSKKNPSSAQGNGKAEGTSDKNPVQQIKAPKLVKVKKGRIKKIKITMQTRFPAKKTTDKIKIRISGNKNVKILKKQQSLSSVNFVIMGKKIGSTQIRVTVGQKSARIKVRCV